MKIFYFASIREKIGYAEEELSLPADVATVGELVAWLQKRGANYAGALSDPRAVRIAVNQEHVKSDYPVADRDEIALFPPVTGG